MAFADELLEQQSAGEAYLRDTVPFRDLVQNLQQEIDTVDESTQAAQEANERATRRAARQQSRYGIGLTPVERQEQAKLAQIGGSANVAGAANFARRRDEAANLSRLSALSEIFTNERASALNALSTIGNIATQRKNAYTNERAKSANQAYGFLGKVGGQIGSALGSLI